MFADKQNASFPGRTFYPGGGVDWGRFLLWLILVLAAAAALAAGMAEMFTLGCYYVFIVPFIAALCVAGLMHLAVNKGRCRNALIAGLAGFSAGIVLYIGYFYFGMVHDVGPEAAGHLDYLPKYIQLRMATEVTRDVNDPHPDEQKMPGTADRYMNWGRFVFELAIVVGMISFVAWKRAKKPYCAACSRWMDRTVTPFEPALSTELLEALRNGSARSLAALCARAPFSTVPNTSLAVDFCPTLKDGISRDCPVYVSVKTINTVPQRAIRDVFDQSKGKLLVRGLQLNSDELAALGSRVKIFETIAGRSAVSALLPKEDEAEAVKESNLPRVEITPLTSDHAGKIMSRKTVLIGNALALCILLGMFAGLGLMMWGVLTGFPDHPPEGGVPPATRTFAIALLVIGGIITAIAMGIGIFDPGFFGNRYLRKRMRQEFDRRGSVLVDPRDPDAMFVEIVPKLNWGKMMLEDASDVGLLLVDKSRREIRFEGDKERWRIPGAAISYCAIEEFVVRHGHGKTRRIFIVLRANHRDGFWEAPIRERRGTGLLAGKQKKSATRLLEAIQSISSPAVIGTPVS